jgi:hypothetical protein
MIIQGRELHKPAWDRLLVLCETLEAELVKAEDELKANQLDDTSRDVDPEFLDDDNYEDRILSKLEDARYYLETIIEKVKHPHRKRWGIRVVYSNRSICASWASL